MLCHDRAQPWRFYRLLDRVLILSRGCGMALQSARISQQVLLLWNIGNHTCLQPNVIDPLMSSSCASGSGNRLTCHAHDAILQ
jgi:hypothetical protein